MKAPDFVSLAVEGVRALKPYEPGKPIAELKREFGLDDVVKLASNENPLGASAKAIAAIREAVGDVALYPDGNGFDLKRALAARHSIDTACITLGSGSDHVIELLARAFLGPGRNAVMARHGFAIYAITTLSTGAELRVADPLPPDHPAMPYGHDLAAIAAKVDAATRIVFLANPNNPTGTWFDRDALDTLLERVPVETLVVIDEAYFEFVEEATYPNGRGLLDTHPNLVILRTFSKAHGLAGLRVGYGLAHPLVTDLLNRVRLSFNPNALAQVAAVAALADTDHVERIVELNRSERSRVVAALDGAGLVSIPSVCNFVTVDVGRPGREVFKSLLAQGVITRPLDGYGLPNHLRISIGLPAENDRMLAALRDVLGGDAR